MISKTTAGHNFKFQWDRAKAYLLRCEAGAKCCGTDLCPMDHWSLQDDTGKELAWGDSTDELLRFAVDCGATTVVFPHTTDVKDENYCQDTDDHEHVPAWDNITKADYNPASPYAVIDVPCSKCGRSGSFTVKAEDIHW